MVLSGKTEILSYALFDLIVIYTIVKKFIN